MTIKISTFFLLLILYTGTSNAQDQTHSNNSISIVGVGDIMLGTNFPNSSLLPANKGQNLMRSVNATLRQADLTFGNLEGTILNQGETTKKGCKKCYAFRMPDHLADNFVTSGFDVLSIANNHIRDFGTKGIKNTIRVLKQKGIATAGVTQLPSTTFTKNGVRYGFAAFAPNIGTIDIRDIANAKRIVRDLEQKSDIVIVSFHGGAEGPKHQHVTKKSETYYGENRGNVYKFSHAVIDAGADIVFGHGPHVTRAVEVYKDRFIAYSMGNFCTYGPFSLKEEKGFAPMIKLNVGRYDGKFQNGQIISIMQKKGSGVFPDPRKQALRKIQYLTKADGFSSGISIDSNGFMKPATAQQ